MASIDREKIEVVVPLSNSDQRRERLVSEWSLTKVFQKLFPGVARLNNREFLLDGYYIKFKNDLIPDGSSKIYLGFDEVDDSINLPNIIDIQVSAQKPQSTGAVTYKEYEIPDVTQVLKIVNEGTYYPFELGEGSPKDTVAKNKVYIDRNNFIIWIYDKKDSLWHKCGAVYK